MRIEQLHLHAYGPFTGQDLDFSVIEPNFQLIYGPNEAGKSSTLRALSALFYNYPKSTLDSHIHEFKNLRVGACLVHSDGSTLDFVRRKSPTKSIFDATDKQPLNERSLDRFLDGVDSNRFDELFGLDHAKLRAGGKAMVEGGGDLQEALVAAAGLQPLHQILKDLQKEMELLFKPKGTTKPTISLALGEWNVARDVVIKAGLKPSEWTEQNRILGIAKADLIEVETKLKTLRTQKSRRQSLIDARPMLDERKITTSELEILGEFVPLDDGFSQRRRDANASRILAQGNLSNAQAEVGRLEEAIHGLGAPSPLLASEKAIQELLEARVIYRKDVAERLALMVRLEHNQKDFATRFAAIRPELDPDQVDQLRFQTKLKQRFHNVADRRVKFFVERDSAVADVERLAKGETESSPVIHAGNVEPLRSLAQRLRVDGDLEAQLIAAQTTTLKHEKKAENARKAMGLWHGPLEETASLQIPSTATVDRIDAQMSKLASEVSAAEKEINKATKLKSQAQREIKQHQASGAIPSEPELIAARVQRDELWRVYIESPLKVLSEAVGSAILAADELADRLRRESDRVATLARYETELARAETDLQSAKFQHEHSSKAAFLLENEWLSVWQSAGITPLIPREMAPWISNHAKLLRIIEDVEISRDKAISLERSIEQGRRDIGQLLEDDVLDKQHSLIFWLDHVENLIRQFDSQAERRRDRARAKARLARVRQSGVKSDQTWSKMVKRLGVTRSATPEQVRQALQSIDELFDLGQTIRDDEIRLAEIEQTLVEFRSDTISLASKMNIHSHEENDPTLILAAIEPLLKAARANETTRQSMAKQHKNAMERVVTATKTLAEAEAQLEALRDEARCDTIEDLVAAERRAAEGAGLLKTLRISNKQLSVLAGSTSVDELISEAEAANPDENATLIDTISREIEALDLQRTGLVGQVATVHSQVLQMDGRPDAANASELIAKIESRIQSDVDRYVQMKITSRLLSDSLHNFREKHRAPVMQRASLHFQALTLGSFARLTIDEDGKGPPMIVGVRSGEPVNVKVTGMSDGTADALFLALRIAAIEEHLKTRQALPVIADDLLINFDDGRAAAALRVLFELATKTQVLFFTHHARLRDLASEVLSLPDSCVHTLPGRTGSSWEPRGNPLELNREAS